MAHNVARLAALAVGAICLGGAAQAAELNLICSADIEVCGKMVQNFEASHKDIHVNSVRLSAGEAYAKIRAEARNPQADLWWSGSGDAHLQAAEDKLTMVYKSPHLDQLKPWAQKQAKISGYRTVGVYAGVLGWGYNTKIFDEKHIKAPKCWADLLDPSLKGEIQIADPNSSGTAYTALATLVQLMGEDKAFDYLHKLGSNVSQYTKSGSAPIKAAARGEAGLGIVFQHDAVTEKVQGFPIAIVSPCEGTGYEVGSMSIIDGAQNLKTAKVFYEWALSAKAQNMMPAAGSYQIPSNKDATTSDKAPRLDDVKLIDYDFAKYGSGKMREHLLSRWTREIGNGS
ncbi:ABC transporter substrate-binding protein [Acidimangrovimonas sediminis]|uniref:ABC transporter substrate-binding protein n=1 Tax=Acidimangrovimonas sediminis TaxID=2056283 RepID=UPI000C7FC4DA|nr:ABC transporter substrate-binding protein [Acidimangrovimonas sediminis]